MMVVGQYFIHQIKLTTKYGKEPKNRPQTLEEIRSGKINFVDGRTARSGRQKYRGRWNSQLSRTVLFPIGRHWEQEMKITCEILGPQNSLNGESWCAKW
jgi:hypothetical protein